MLKREQHTVAEWCFR